MTNATTTKTLFYNCIQINSTVTSVKASNQRFAPAGGEDNEGVCTTSQPVVTTKRLALVQDFINQVWYGILEIKGWRKKFGVYIIDLAPVSASRYDFTEFMRSWMDVHARFELQDPCFY